MAYPCSAGESVKVYEYVVSWQPSENKQEWMSLYERDSKAHGAAIHFEPTENKSWLPLNILVKAGSKDQLLVV